MSQAEERRERNRRRWRRRRRRQLVVLLVLFPLLVGAALLSTNVVGVLGGIRGITLDALSRPRPVHPGSAVKKQHLHERVPVILPVPNTEDLIGTPSVRVTEPLPQRFYQPGSHISPLVKWKLSQLRNVSQQNLSSAIALPHRSVQPKRLNALDAVFQPTNLEPRSSDDPVQEFWEIERLYVEAGPSSTTTLLGTTPIPEPGTGALMSLGLVALAVRRRARIRRPL